MKLTDINNESMVSQYIIGCLNDFELGISTKDETELYVIELIVFLIEKDRQNHETTKYSPTD